MMAATSHYSTLSKYFFGGRANGSKLPTLASLSMPNNVEGLIMWRSYLNRDEAKSSYEDGLRVKKNLLIEAIG